MAKQWVYMFSEGNADQRNLLGGKGANLAEMTRIGLPVPQGFTVSTEACLEYLEQGKLTDEMVDQIHARMEELNDISGKRFGDEKNPLLEHPPQQAADFKGVSACSREAVNLTVPDELWQQLDSGSREERVTLTRPAKNLRVSAPSLAAASRAIGTRNGEHDT